MSTTFRTDKQLEQDACWYIVDANDMPVGRLASRIAQVLRGKGKPQFAPHQDCGDFVVVINGDKVKFTGNKLQDKTYYRHTGYVGGVKSETPAQVQEREPGAVLTRAVKGMLPKTHLGRKQLKKLRVYAGEEHPHAAQQPQPLSF